MAVRVRQSSFVRHNAIFFIGSLATGVLNYLYYPLLGRLLQPAAFGEVQTLVALFLQITTFLSVMGLLAINILVNQDNQAESHQVVMELEKVALYISLIFLAATLLGGSFLQTYFNFGSSGPFTVLMITLVVTVPFTFRSSYLRAQNAFREYSVANVASSALKLVFSAALVVAGFSTSGAIFGIALSQLLAFFYVARYAQKYGFGESLRTHITRRPNMRLILPELRYSLLVLAGSLTVTVLYSVDILVVKHYFDAHTAGLYASIATVSRILFFLTASVSLVLMSAIKIKNPLVRNLQILLKSFALLAVVGLSTLIFFWAVPDFVVGTLMGKAYLPYTDLLPRLSLAIFFVSIVNLLLTYYMALREYAAGFMAVAGAILTYGLMQSSHSSPAAVVTGLLYGSMSLVIVLIVWLAWTSRSLLAVKPKEVV